MKHQLCRIDDIPETGTLLVPFFGREVHVYKVQGRIRAAANTCLHFGGPLECRDGRLVCQWHGASFDPASGDRLKGPAPKGSRLMFLSTRVDGDVLNYVWGE
ncbi:Rieske (2Fe-2S) protein [Mesorhizobium sp. ANAO-SY3R2]|uniref:Rieske (2Fe-2S) protein n=1 Tax=Mesorhizobium sp. ANAO-SY3R2 TaxID=3166644 RepID=UPI00366B120C